MNREREEYRLKLAIIAGASRALDYKSRNPRATEQETMQNVSDSFEEIIGKIEDEFC